MFSDRLVIVNDLRELRRMSAWLQDACAAADFGADLAGRLDLCANELVANIISYAFDDGQRHEIALEVTAAPEGASLTVRDNGRPFNLLEAPAHRQPESIEQARIGGLGIHLVRQLSSGCRYRRDGGFNVLTVDLAHQALRRHA